MNDFVEKNGILKMKKQLNSINSKAYKYRNQKGFFRYVPLRFSYSKKYPSNTFEPISTVYWEVEMYCLVYPCSKRPSYLEL